ncbi:MAG TPA: fused MFS/spermidine synthase [Candidatus Angelobacter sp.]|nr:fused MFS/spermidine synthase [Candidatus Angelobacter sp.]
MARRIPRAACYLNSLMSPINWLYAVAIFLGSFLLFLVEPIAAKRLLPLLGGSAAVWTTCLVFFQVALLFGYLCAHWLANRLHRRAQSLVYVGLLAACVIQAGMNLHPALHASTAHPITSVFWVLGSLIGLPFLVLSANNPLLQSWYAIGFGPGRSAGTAGGEAVAVRPPYRLFALSNFGSLLALLIYPWLVEPRFSLRAQSVIWFSGFIVFSLACAGIAFFQARAARGPVVTVEQPKIAADAPLKEEPQPPLSDRVLWLLLAGCGSLLLCAMTNHIVQNVAAVPLLWIVPLTMYLLSFVIAFSRGQWMPRLLRVRIPVFGLSIARMCLLGFTAVALGGLVYITIYWRSEIPLWLSLPFYSLALLILCLFCHAELHRLCPSPRYATSFYLMISAGGAVGSLFVGVAAPLIFSGSYELMCGLVVTTLLILAVTWALGIGWRIFWGIATIGIAVLLIYSQAHEDDEHTTVRVRNFYGALRVSEDLSAPFNGITRVLYNGTITHGTEIFTSELRDSPTSYYGHHSGVGLALDVCCEKRPRRVGIIGLGAGTLAAYGRSGDVFRFYDINPLVEDIAKNTFFYVRDSKAKVDIVTGDARLSMEAEPPQGYDVLIVDAFSSDAIPVHLLTAQAIALYRRHLKPDGILAIHVSNKYLNLIPVVEQEAENADLESAYIASYDEDDIGVYSADWVLVTANDEFLSRSEIAENIAESGTVKGLRLWTDDYNSVLPLLKWRIPKPPPDAPK